MRAIARLIAIAALIVAAAVLTALPASAQPELITVPIDTIVRAPVGSITVLATADVPPDVQGRTCTGRAESANQASVHPDNNLLIETGGVVVVIAGVEAQAGELELISEPITMGPTVTVSLEMGPDEVFSGGFLGLHIDCPPPPTTTTTTTTSTTTTSTTTTTTTTSVPPTIPLTTPPSVAPTTQLSPTTIVATGADATGPGTFGGLALVTAGAFLVLLAELRRRMRGGSHIR